ncbi:6-hydroxymethylpterin diphosphokinase MptE-like protein [Syntrophotalea acetylenivorans]|uniref:6-hydroxymethylpterin diphosphokinase MptE-like protein n=1 Tax=Syntrophotalea acetylenivorans TaxID=1842532 RepID=UPI000AD30957|nr:6-hydroxymethylpterin diphosphokinase MptE-like protein [Syntrophotalea acetylenivorans]
MAGAGPTLAESFDLIKRQQQAGQPLIAVGSALKPLFNADIIPDVVVVVDPGREEVLKLFSGFDLDPFTETPLVYFPSVHRDILELWTGPLLTAYAEHPLYHDLSEKCPKQKLFSAGSVLHPAVDLAVCMGADEIVLLGADFGFPNGYSHVAGAATSKRIDEKAHRHWVHDGTGGKIPTTPNMRDFLRDLEAYIENKTQVRFLNASRKGAFIKGTAFMEGAL